MEIHTTSKAKQDLENIWIYSFQKWGEKQADKYFDEIDYALKILLANPEIGTVCNHIRAEYRKYKINQHLVFYKLTSNKIRIIRLLHKIWMLLDIFLRKEAISPHFSHPQQQLSV